MQCSFTSTRILLMASMLAVVFDANLPASDATKTLAKQPAAISARAMECTPILHQGRQILFQSFRSTVKQPGDTYLALKDVATGKQLCRFGEGYSLGCAYVHGDQINVYATQNSPRLFAPIQTDIYRFTSTNMKDWTKTLAVARSGDEQLFNSSVCQDEQGYLMAYETTKPVSFCIKFARSKDLADWTKLDVPTYAGASGKEYSACPMIRYVKPYYYVIFVRIVYSPKVRFVPFLMRSKDLTTWQVSAKPVMEPSDGEGCNNSDVDLIEVDGKTHVYYATGDQTTWLELKQAVYPGPMREFFESYFPRDSQTVDANTQVK